MTKSCSVSVDTFTLERNVPRPAATLATVVTKCRLSLRVGDHGGNLLGLGRPHRPARRPLGVPVSRGASAARLAIEGEGAQKNEKKYSTRKTGCVNHRSPRIEEKQEVVSAVTDRCVCATAAVVLVADR